MRESLTWDASIPGYSLRIIDYMTILKDVDIRMDKSQLTTPYIIDAVDTKW